MLSTGWLPVQNKVCSSDISNKPTRSARLKLSCSLFYMISKLTAKPNMLDNQADQDYKIDLDNLHQKTMQELKKIAKDIGLTRVSALKKQFLIDRIREELTQNRPDSQRESNIEVPKVEAHYGDQDHIQSYDNKKEGRKKKSPAPQRNQRGSQGQKKHVSNVLPESDAPTLNERLEEITPQLGKSLLKIGR